MSGSSSASASATACDFDGKQLGAGCHDHACLIGLCFCGDGSGGDTCERGGRQRQCAAAEQVSYGAGATGLQRHAQHDVCAFYEPAYGIMRVDDRRWRAAQQWEAALWSSAPKAHTTDRNDHHSAQVRASCL